MTLEKLTSDVVSGRDLTADEMRSAIVEMLEGRASHAAMAELLLALRAKGESVSELVGAAQAMRQAMIPIRTSRQGLLDTCGTGGDGAKTFNISTAAAIVAAAAGATIAKHGNRKITSATGSADVLAELGIRIDAPREVVEQCLDGLGICFCFAPLLHPAMRHVGEVRRSLGVPTLFNYLGPLCNPAGASYQLLGVGRADLQEKIAAAVAQLPIKQAIIVRGFDGLDEVTLNADTSVLHVESGRVKRLIWRPGDFGLEPIDVAELLVETPKQSAEKIRAILAGERFGGRDIVLANVSAALWISGIAENLPRGVAMAQQAIDSGKAREILAKLAQASHATTSA